jgi:hypothetical protein
VLGGAAGVSGRLAVVGKSRVVVGVSAAGLALSRRAVSEEQAVRKESSGYVDVPGPLVACV